MNYKDYIKNIPNYPIDGVLFRDITSFIENGKAFKSAIKEFTKFAKEREAEIIVGPESRGFIFGCPVAYELEIGFVPIRKQGKLPREIISFDYSLEYGSNTLEIHKDSIKKGQRVVIVDDLLATGGTTKAAIELIEKLGGIVVGICFLIELREEFNSINIFDGYDVMSLVKY